MPVRAFSAAHPAQLCVLPGGRWSAGCPQGAHGAPGCARGFCARGAPVQLQQRAAKKEREVAIKLRFSSWETKAKTNDK